MIHSVAIPKFSILSKITDVKLQRGQQNNNAAILGKDAQGNDAVFPAGTSAKANEVPGCMPSNRPWNGETILYTNGLDTDEAAAREAAQQVANATGSKVLIVYNSTEGRGADYRECLAQKMGFRRATSRAKAQLAFDELKAGRPANLMAHSQGGIIDRRTLILVSKMVDKAIKNGETFNPRPKIILETMGGASKHYPKSTKNLDIEVIAYAARGDVVAKLFGVQESKDNVTSVPIDRKDMADDLLGRIKPRAQHSIAAYLEHRRPPSEVLAQRDAQKDSFGEPVDSREQMSGGTKANAWIRQRFDSFGFKTVEPTTPGEAPSTPDEMALVKEAEQFLQSNPTAVGATKFLEDLGATKAVLQETKAG